MIQFNKNSIERKKKGSEKKRFAFPGSKIHPIPLLSYTIEHMTLKIKPDLVNKILVDCEQQLTIRAFDDLSEIVFNISDLKVKKVNSKSINISKFRCVDNRQIIIEFAEQVRAGSTVDIDVSYSAGYTVIDGKEEFGSPKTGFHFITKGDHDKQSTSYQAWTQGEATESRFWFPSIDLPQVKFTLDIEISVPPGYMVISNGILESKVSMSNDNTTWKYVETNPLPPYLVSVVIGKFLKYETIHNEACLHYYWPEDIPEENAMLTFSETPQMIRFFEEYFDIKYPFQKYAQVAVDNFEFGGMENLSCTTLTRGILHDKKTALDYKNDILLIAHELAHQWFGNMVTCKDWSHIWLNEGFATYCESLYIENSRGRDEFHYGLIESTDVYFEEANESYARPIVTNIYKHPDELFDAHSYEKAGFVLHMLRNYLGENDFRRSVTKYLNKFRNLSVTSTDFIETIEETSGIEMRTFFDQWIYRIGHPELEIEYSIIEMDQKKNSKNGCKIKIKVTQLSRENIDQLDSNPHRFQLEIKIIVQDINGYRKEILDIIQISEWISEHIIDVDRDHSIAHISIDPNFKNLIKINSIKILEETEDFQLKYLLMDQLKSGDTVIERIAAARILKDFFSDEVIEALGYAVSNDEFYGVSTEAAKIIGSFYDKNNYEKSDKAFKKLLNFVSNKENFKNLNHHIQSAIIKNIGLFGRLESINLLILILEDPNGFSDFTKSAAANALGKGGKNTTTKQEKERIISLLKHIVNSSKSFQAVIATGALEGLSDLPNTNNKYIYLETINFLLENTNQSKDYFVRAKSTKLLGKFLANKFNSSDPEILNMNQKVFVRLKELLNDERRKIKINACEALSYDDAKFANFPQKSTYESMQILIEIARDDIDGFVRRKAETSANRIREWIKEWANHPLNIDPD